MKRRERSSTDKRHKYTLWQDSTYLGCAFCDKDAHRLASLLSFDGAIVSVKHNKEVLSQYKDCRCIDIEA